MATRKTATRKTATKQATEERSLSYDLGRANGLVLEPTLAGVPVSAEKLLTISSFFDGVRTIAESIASLPLHVYEELPDGGRRKAKEHPSYRLLHDAPNEEQTSFQWRAWMIVQLLVYGNGFSEIERAGSGRPIAIHPIPHSAIDVRRSDNGRLYYQLVDGQRVISPLDMIHLQAIGLDPIKGIEPMEVMRESAALTLALERFGASFFGQSARPSGYLKVQGKLSDTAKDNLKASWKRTYSGTANTGMTPLLEEGVEWIKSSVDPEEGQYNDTRSFQLREVSRWLKISPTKLGDLSRATWSNLEQENLSYVQSTLNPLICRLESELRRRILLPSEQETYCVELDVAGLLRGDTATRYAAYSSALTAGWMSVNEIREREGLPPKEGGDELRLPLANGPVGTDPAASQEPPQESQEPDDGDELEDTVEEGDSVA